MKILDNLVNMVLGLKDIVSEPVRCEIARRVSSAIMSSIGDDALWRDQGNLIFLKKCRVESGSPVVPDDINVEATKLALFIDKWATVQLYREPDGEWKPISPEMRNAITTMIEEIKEL